MLLDLKRVFQEEDLRMPFDGELDFSDEELYGEYPFKKPVRISGIVDNQNRVVRMRYSAVVYYERSCDRCLEQASREFKLELEHILAADSEQLSQQIEETGIEQDELVIVNNYSLDLDGLAREDIILEMPTKFLCDEECKGLCPDCGCNLNNSQCGCSRTAVDPRLESLRQLLAESGDED